MEVVASWRVRDGENVNLTCNTTCNLASSPSFIWSKDGRPVAKKQIIYNQLQLHPFTYEDEGHCTCAVRGHENRPSLPYRLQVMYPPKDVYIPVPKDEIIEGSRVTLTCMSEVHPPVHTYTWIKKSGAVEIKSGEEKTLTLSNICPEDSGEYLCRAVNRIDQQASPAVSVNVVLKREHMVVPIIACGALGVICTYIWMRNRRHEKKAQQGHNNGDDVTYADVQMKHFRRTGGPAEAEAAKYEATGGQAAGGTEDDVQYVTVQPKCSRKAGGEGDRVQYVTVQPKCSRKAGGEGNHVQYASVQKKASTQAVTKDVCHNASVEFKTAVVVM